MDDLAPDLWKNPVMKRQGIFLLALLVAGAVNIVASVATAGQGRRPDLRNGALRVPDFGAEAARVDLHLQHLRRPRPGLCPLIIGRS
jgi:hypothetical protein